MVWVGVETKTCEDMGYVSIIMLQENTKHLDSTDTAASSVSVYRLWQWQKTHYHSDLIEKLEPISASLLSFLFS